MTLLDKCKELNISYSAIQKYMRVNKCSEEEAFIRYRPDLYINILGRLSGYTHFYDKSLIDICKERKLKYSTVIAFRNRNKCTDEEALKYVEEISKHRDLINDIKNLCKKEGIEYKSYEKWCRFNNLDNNKESFYKYINTKNNAKNKAKMIKHLEEKYKCEWHSVTEYMRRHNIDVSSMNMEEQFIIFNNNKSTRNTDMSLSNLCKVNKLNLNSVRTYCRRHNLSNLSNIEKINIYINRKRRIPNESKQ